MRREIAGGGDEDVVTGRAQPEAIPGPDGGLDHLDRVEVPVFPEQQRSERRREPRGVAARCEERR
jgi:hypothetical protein